MKYFNSRLNLTAEPARLYTDHYAVEINGELRMIPKSLIEGSADWVKQPDWVITAFKHCECGHIWTLGDCLYWHGGDRHDLHDMLHKWPSVDSGHFEIHSVRRSDGVEFKVGDITNKGLITAFRKVNNDMMAAFENDLRRSHIEDIEPAPAVLFTTHDGVDITDEKTEIWHVDKVDFTCNKSNAHYFSPIERLAYFSTHKAAENYIAENKPMYSIADIRKAWGGFRCGVNDFFELLKQVK